MIRLGSSAVRLWRMGAPPKQGSLIVFRNIVPLIGQHEYLPHRMFSAATADTNKKGLLGKIKDGAVHYWNGTKLLALETKVSAGLLRKILKGQKLIRRERLQLIRTLGDLFRLVPFIVILVVPFLEFALPVLLRFFPNMLPSTFEDRLQAEEKVKKQLKIKLETAKFLQEMADSMSDVDDKVADLKNLFKKARLEGYPLQAEEVYRVCSQLGDLLTLDKFERPLLLKLCRYMGISSFGTDNYLRYQIEKSISRLKADDLLIAEEGIDSLSSRELQTACHARGIRTIGVSEEFMKKELSFWIDLQLKHSVPAPLIILSRAFLLTDLADRPDEALQKVVKSLPDSIVENFVKEEGSELKDAKIEPETRLELIQREQELIDAELKATTKPKTLNANSSSLSPDQLEAISDAVETFTTSPAAPEKKDLDMLKTELNENNGTEPTNSVAKALESQVEKLITDIDNEIKDFEAKIGDRIKIIDPTLDGQISTKQLESILLMVRDSPKDAERLSQIIKTFDQDGDGKVFLKDIIDMAQRAVEQDP